MNPNFPPTTKAKQRFCLECVIRSLRANYPQAHAEIAVLVECLDQMHNRSPVKRAPPTAQPITQALADQIRDAFRANPTLTNHDLAAQYGIADGRISNVLAGVRV